MIVVKLCMRPGGDESREREFGRVLIRNLVSGTLKTEGEFGDYVVEIRGDGLWRGPAHKLYEQAFKSFKLTRFPRSTHHAWDLLFCALRAVFGERNTPHYLNPTEKTDKPVNPSSAVEGSQGTA